MSKVLVIPIKLRGLFEKAIRRAFFSYRLSGILWTKRRYVAGNSRDYPPPTTFSLYR